MGQNRTRTGDAKLAAAIRAYREKHGLTIRAFAILVGMSRMSAWRAEQGKPLGIYFRAHLRKFIGKADA